MKDNTTRHDKRGRVLRTAEERQELVAAFKGSGMGMTEFCQERDVRKRPRVDLLPRPAPA